MSNVIPIIGHNAPRTPDEWRAYIAEATVMEERADQSKVEAIIEKGRRIAELHRAYNEDKGMFGKPWAEACKDIAGVDQSVCSKYETITSNFIHTMNKVSFPQNIECLYDLARAAKASPKAFDEAIIAGEIRPSMSRAQAKAFADRAKSTGGGKVDTEDETIVKLFNEGYRDALIGRKLGWTGTSQQVRSRIAKRREKLGLFKTERKRPRKEQKPSAAPRAMPGRPGGIDPVGFKGTKEEWRRLVDPEFTGTPIEFTDKYGHVQVMTAEQYARDRFGAWALNVRALMTAAKKLPDWPPVDHNWLRSPRPLDVAKLAEALEYLRPMMEEAEALLKSAQR